jgi:hypothetical protein
MKSAEMNLTMTHHAYDEMYVCFNYCDKEPFVEIFVNDRHEGFSAENSRIRFTALEFSIIAKKLDGFQKALTILKGE